MNYYPFILLLIFIIFTLAGCYPLQESYTTSRTIASDALESTTFKEYEDNIRQLNNEISELDENDPTETQLINLKIQQRDQLQNKLDDLKSESEDIMKYSTRTDIDYRDEDIQEDSNIGFFEGENQDLFTDSELFDHEEASKKRHESSNFFPTYEDSVFLSRLSDLSYSKPVHDSASIKGGFCKSNMLDPYKIEEQCLKLDKNVCASTDCCVLLGGSKCVAGKKIGPIFKSHYNDPGLLKKDHYYYKGHCYGNC